MDSVKGETEQLLSRLQDAYPQTENAMRRERSSHHRTREVIPELLQGAARIPGKGRRRAPEMLSDLVKEP